MRWSLLLAVALLIPVAAAHSSSGAEYERLVWRDGMSDPSAWQDGYDLHELWMWEAYDPAIGEGIMVRLHLAGGNVTGLYDTSVLHATFQVGNSTTTFRWWTTDDATWQGDLPLTMLASNRSESELAVLPVALPGGSWLHEMQVFVPLRSINATVGDTVSGWTWRTTVERDAATGGRVAADVDVAPGGFWITGTPAELPEQPSLPETRAIEIFLRGPGQHLEADGEWSNDLVILRVRNPYNETDQTISVVAPPAARAIMGPTAAIAPGAEAVFVYQVPLKQAPQALAWTVLSDIGGHARLEVTLPAAPAPDPPAAQPPAPVPSQPLERTDPRAEPPADAEPADQDIPLHREKEAPTGLWVVVGAVLVALRRRR